MEDAAFVLALLNSPKWLQYIGDRQVHTLEEASVYIKDRMRPQLERLGFSNYTVIRKSDGVKMGSCGLYDREGLEGVDIGFAFLPDFEKQGYAFESAQKIKVAGFEQFDLSQINAITLPANRSSQRLLERLGFQFMEVVQLPNDADELMLYRMDKQMYFDQKDSV